ncbi:MAG: hypothetical protein CME68_01955 [Halobacteriovoraceae bacterium]|nr:hypothetical protein [Halobacteriovoraceae bacterium]
MTTPFIIHGLTFGAFFSFLSYDLLFYKWYQRGDGKKDKNTSTLLQCFLTLNLTFSFYCFFKGLHFSYQENILLMSLGLILCLLGLYIRVWAIKTLKSMFSWKISIQKDHELIKRGPYKIVRHPSYSGGLLAIFGFNLALGTMPALLCFMITYLPVLLVRIKKEELVLGEYFKNDYEEYKNTSYSLIPFLY